MLKCRGFIFDAFADSINELHERIHRLNKCLDDIKREKEKALKISILTDAMVDDLLVKTHAILETTDRKELKAALSHFIERILIDSHDVTIEYIFRKPSIANVLSIGDPGGH